MNKNKKIKILIALISISIIATACIIILDKNAYKTNINENDFSFDYTITAEAITVTVTPNVDIKNFKFLICCTRTENILHQYNNYYEIELAKSKKELIYKYKFFDIEKEKSWAKYWKIDTVKLYQYSGQKQNKNR